MDASRSDLPPAECTRAKTADVGPAAKADGGLEMKVEGSTFGGRAQELKEGMSVIDIVIFEHNAVKELWQQYQAAKEGRLKEAKAQLIINQLAQHGGKEEIVLYPVMKKQLADGEREVEHAKQEHQELMETLDKIDKLTWAKAPAEFDRLMHAAMADLMHHIDDEERDLLPALREKLSSKELVDLGKQFQSAIVATRPHTMAPREGIPAAIANAASLPLDKARDAARFTSEQRDLAMKEMDV